MKLTPEQLAELIAKIFANINEKRKARKEAEGEAQEGITTDEILAEVSSIIEGMGGAEEPPAEGGEKAEDPTEGGDSAVSADLVAQIIAALEEKGIKAGEKPSETKAGGPSATATPQRKYANLFLANGGVSRDGNTTSGFKARIATMSGPERRKAAYGMFGRAVK